MREQIANHTIQRASRQYLPPPQDDADEDDEYTTGMPRSALRYTMTQPYTIQQGNRRLVFHPEPPPKRSKHWLFYVGIGMLAMIALWLGFQMLGNWWSAHQLDATYGFPRTYQVDEVVGHTDSTDHPTHFIFLNRKYWPGAKK